MMLLSNGEVGLLDAMPIIWSNGIGLPDKVLSARLNTRNVQKPKEDKRIGRKQSNIWEKQEL